MKKKQWAVLFIFSILLCPLAPSPVFSGNSAIDIVINVPPMPSNFPKAFPVYKKCTVKGVRWACYGKTGVRQLLLLWNRFMFLRSIPPLVEKQDTVLQSQRKLTEHLEKQSASLQRALQNYKTTTQKLKAKIKLDADRRKAAHLRNIFIGVGVAVAAVAVGIVVGYAVGSTQSK